MPDENVDIIVRLSQLQKFVSDIERAAASLEGIGTKAKTGSERATTSMRKVPGVVGLITRAGHNASAVFGKMSNAAERAAVVIGSRMRRIREEVAKPFKAFGGRIGGIGAGLIGGAFAYLGISQIKSAANETTNLAKQAASLHAVTGMTVQDAATWIALTQAYDVNTRSMSMAFKALGTQFYGVQTGAKASIQLFLALGVTQNELKSNAHNLNGMLMLVIDKLQKMPGGAEKTALATKLLGRGWMALMPIIAQGSAAIDEQRQEAAAYGVELGSNATANAIKLHDAQVRLKLAGIGLQVAFTMHILPALLKFIQYVMKGVLWLKQQLTPAFSWVSHAIKDTTHWIKEHNAIWHNVLLPTLKVAGAVLLALWAVSKIFAWGRAVIGTIKAVMGVIRGMTALVVANPWILLAAAVAAAAILIITHWTAVKTFFGNLHDSIVKWFSNMGAAIRSGFETAVNWIIGKINDVIGFWNALPFTPHINPIGLVGAQPVNTAQGMMSTPGGGTAPYRPPSSYFTGKGGVAVPYKAPHLTNPAPGLMSVPGGGTEPYRPPGSVGKNIVEPKFKGAFHLTTHVNIDRREVARATGKFTSDRLARQ